MPAKPDSGERWHRVEEIFHAALERPPEDRLEYVQSACASDADVRREVEGLLNAVGSAGGLLDQPAIAQMRLANPPPAWMPGMTIGHYRVVEFLGAGGMGEVFRARDTRLDRDVALKTLLPDLAHDRLYLERLRREARVLASLNHPNIATLYEIEEASGQVALVMEIVDGETLANRLSHSKLRTSDTLRLAAQIAEGLEAAHRKGVVHRDLKPGNIMISECGKVKLLDFGLAKRGVVADGHGSMTLTSGGTVLGTSGYMSPEQAEGGEADQRSDIFSFGAILYEMLAGRPAFGGETAAQRLAAVLRDEPKVEDLGLGVPNPLLRLIRLCLRKPPDERYQSMTDVKFVIEELRDNWEHGERLVSSPALSRRQWIFGAALAAGGAALSYVALQLRRESRPPTIVSPLTMYEGHAQSPALSPDGKMVAFIWDGEREDNIDVYLKVIASGDPLRLTSNPRPEVRPLWSPDGRFLAFSRTRAGGPSPGGTETICTIPVLGGQERIIGTGFANDWSPDGTLLLALVANEGAPAAWVLVSVADGSSRRLVSTPPGSTLGRGRFSPDGRNVYYIDQTAPAESRLNAIPLSGGDPKPVPISGLCSIDDFAWAAPNDLVVVGRTSQSITQGLYRVRTSGGQAHPMAFGDNSSAVDTFPGSGLLVYTHDQLVENIWRVGAWPGTDRQPRKWIATGTRIMNPSVSFAGDRIAFASSRSGAWTIWTSDAEGNGAAPALRSLSVGAGMVGSPAWSPEGRRIAFDVHVGGHPNIFVVDLQSGAARPVTEGNGKNIVPAWSPDGEWIYYTSSVTGLETIWRVPASGGEPRQITHRGGYSVKISPDGKYLYYLKSQREGELWRASTATGEEELLIREFKNRNFWVLPEGVYLLDPGVSEISPFTRGRARFYRFRTRKIEDLGFETEKPIDHYGISLSPEGKWLYYIQADLSASNVMLIENFR